MSKNQRNYLFNKKRCSLKKEKSLVYILSFFLVLLIVGVGLISLRVYRNNLSSSKIRVGVIDGYSTDESKFKLSKRTYAHSSTSYEEHANVVWSVLSKHIDNKNLDCFEYNVIEENGNIERNNLLKALNKAESDQVNIINFSGGFYVEDQEIKEKINNLIKKGVVFVAAAGNNSQGMADFPARMNNVISVGSKNDKKISEFSSIKHVDIYEQGEAVMYKGKKFEGTSFAAPKVTNKIISYSINNQVSLLKAKETVVKEKK